MSIPYTIFTLANGLRVVHREEPSTELVHCGLFINTGSRDENNDNNGVAHFIEHTVFKGTEKRRSHHILTRLESVGGELNAFTTREKTCYYASVLAAHTDRSLELLADITFHSVFPEKEIEKEKRVIIEEIDMYEDSPEESIYDDFYLHLFGDHPLGYNILGTRETVSNLSREKIRGFLDAHYGPQNMVLSVLGNISLARVQRMAEKHFGGFASHNSASHQRQAPQPKSVFRQEESKDFVQTHCMMGSPAYGRHDEKRYALMLLNNILGGSGMSSRLNMSVREKYALTYGISSHYSRYDDAGVFSIYFSCDQKNLRRCIEVTMRELRRLCRVPLSPRQLNIAKQQMLGGMAMALESNNFHMQYQARSLMDYGRIRPFSDFLNRLNLITPEELLEVANEIFEPEKLSTLVYRSGK